MASLPEMTASVGSILATLMFIWAMVRQYVPPSAQSYLSAAAAKLFSWLSPSIHVTFPEHTGEQLRRSEAFAAIESYLSASSADTAHRLRAEVGKDSTSLVFSMDDHEDVPDIFKGANLTWTAAVNYPDHRRSRFPYMDDNQPECRREYRISFHRAHRRLVIDKYLPHVLAEGRAIKVKQRERRLFTNASSYDWVDGRRVLWSHVAFQHPATFDTLAMQPDKKRSIIDDLISFTRSKEYYNKIGKPWKRGYLLHGPPGTGKSTMIAAIANLLEYDIYDLELTAVKNNTALRKLLIETTPKSLMVIEDIDCSLDLFGKREGAKQDEKEKPEEAKESKVTLSGLLNFIDGLWSACGGERLVVFTTNHLEKLDPALIRRGRMDVHVDLSYCCFHGFKVLARNYLGLDDHPLFDDIKKVISQVQITPADVAEELMPKTIEDGDGTNVEARLKNLFRAMAERKNTQSVPSQPAGEEDDGSGTPP